MFKQLSTALHAIKPSKSEAITFLKPYANFIEYNGSTDTLTVRNLTDASERELVSKMLLACQATETTVTGHANDMPINISGTVSILPASEEAKTVAVSRDAATLARTLARGGIDFKGRQNIPDNGDTAKIRTALADALAEYHGACAHAQKWGTAEELIASGRISHSEIHLADTQENGLERALQKVFQRIESALGTSITNHTHGTNPVIFTDEDPCLVATSNALETFYRDHDKANGVSSDALHRLVSATEAAVTLAPHTQSGGFVSKVQKSPGEGFRSI